MPRRSENEIVRFGRLMAEKSGINDVPESKLLGNMSGIAKSLSGLVRDAFVKGVLDQLLQDRVRNLMKWVIHSPLTPQFNTQVGDTTLSSLGDGPEGFEVNAVKPDGDRIPSRMFNVDTGNLEEWIPGDVSYCILSHSWKGDEIVYPFLQAIKIDLREKVLFDDLISQATDEDTRKFAKIQSDKHFHLHADFSDVQLIRIQCLKDLDDQTRKVTTLLAGSVSASPGLVRNNEDSLDREEIFNLRCKAFTNSIGSRQDAILPYLQRLVESKTSGTEGWTAMRHSQPALATAVEQLLPALERLRSLQKIEQSIARTKQVLDSGLFGPVKEMRRYLWNDTICINKRDANELNHSLAMMGEWYASAEFCLVQIDTPWSEWIQTFKHLDKPHMQSETLSIAPSDFGHGLYKTFDDLCSAEPRPKWATRGWTLQELVLPKLAIFVNSVWQPLPRPVEALGPYYYLLAFLSEHVHIDGKTDSLHDLGMLQQIDYLEYAVDDFQSPGISSNDKAWTEKVRCLIALLDFFGVDFSKNMNEDTAEILIQQAISSAADSENNLEEKAAIMKSFGVDLADTHPLARQEARTFIKLVIRALISEAEMAVRLDKKKMSRFGAAPSDECCRGFRRSRNSAQEMLSLAAFRECTVATDRVYSLMGVLGVQFTVFHAEGMTKALSRMLDQVVTTTNDISVFNWTGRDFGSPQRGRSLYPSALEAYDRMKTSSIAVARRMREKHDKVAAFKSRKYTLQLTCKNLVLLLSELAKFIRGQDGRHWDSEPVHKLLQIVKAQKLELLRPQLTVIGKLLSFFESEPAGEADKPETPVSPPTSPPPAPAATPAAEPAAKPRFGIKAPKILSMPSMSASLSNISPSLPSMPSLGMSKSDSTPGSARPVLVSRKSVKMSEVDNWLSKTDSLDESQMTDQVQQILDTINARSLTDLAPRDIVAKGKHRLPVEGAVAPNPIIITTAGIQGLFDVQRVIIDIRDRDVLRQKVQNAASPKQKINGNCRISTAIASLEVNFRCTAEQLIKQINVCDVVDHTVYGDQDSATANDLTSSELQERVERALDFVEETDLNMIAGEWILTRFSGAPAANWFLSTFELGTSHTFYGHRIPTNEIDFNSVEPEMLLVAPWEQYMERKKDAMYEAVGKQLEGKNIQKAIESIDDSLRKGAVEDDEEQGTTLQYIISRTASVAHQAAASFYEREAQRLDAALNDAALQSTPKKLRAAIMNLNDNDELLPAMFVSDVMISIF